MKASLFPETLICQTPGYDMDAIQKNVDFGTQLPKIEVEILLVGVENLKMIQQN